MKSLFYILSLFSTLLFAETPSQGKTYFIKKVKYFASKGEDKNSVAHLVLFHEGKKGHVLEVFCAIPPGEDPAKAKQVRIGERINEELPEKHFLCDLIQ